ncbi:MAG TPA: radical SAM protein [Deltaproteobacteria bacterium]|nr:radical SAM protein [Deltaproteobacteria bacterium]
MIARRPSYIGLYESGELHERIRALRDLVRRCRICPHRCGAARLEGEKGLCRTGPGAVVSSFTPHFGEEAPLVGRYGSGAIFMTGCNLRCVFCQNYDISHMCDGDEVESEGLVSMMLALQRRGCHNINFVTPTHQTYRIVESLPRAVELGLEIPLVYNCGGYESVETLRLLEGIFDIYMPDLKYGDNAAALSLSGAADYVERSREAVAEMHRQVGDLEVGGDGVARRGLIIRHLVLPGGLAGTRAVMEFVASRVSPRSYVNIMDQYRPCYMAEERPPLDRPVRDDEYGAALEAAREAGIVRLATGEPL